MVALGILGILFSMVALGILFIYFFCSKEPMLSVLQHFVELQNFRDLLLVDALRFVSSTKEMSVINLHDKNLENCADSRIYCMLEGCSTF